MERESDRARDVALPSRALGALRASLRREVGALSAIHALQAAGYDAGGAVFDGFARWVGGEPARLGAGEFWARFGAYLRSRGWGDLAHSRPHRGVGLLTGHRWVEAVEDGGEPQPTCALSAGMLSGFLTRAAGGPVAVLEVACMSRGDPACAFAFGSEATIHDLYGLLLEGRGFDQAISAL